MTQETTTPKTVYLKDYQPTPYAIKEVDLTFTLSETATRVLSKLSLLARESMTAGQPLCLNGENLKLLSLKLDGQTLTEGQFEQTPTTLTIHEVPQTFTLEIETEINPSQNKALEGLYITDQIFCTQNESEGFRKITYFYDRPDVLATYQTKIIADKENYPVLLANGNLMESGDIEEGKHFAVWKDPFPKPCYLFALVGGRLDLVQDTFKTQSGREIDLRIYVDPGNSDKCDYAMGALKRAMKWDEDTFGRECDLDIYMIVAVSAFNFGAMENKGLNIFNSQYILANPETATDQNYEAIESVIGHEYFHNWSGNRVTCRDWFQITLKEGLTIFRDQEFSADMMSREVKRIADAKILRDYQFAEDAGPNSHPIQPQTYIEINNFYTTTVYQKGSEVIRMIHTLIGKENFRKGMDLYFSTYDGKAVTTEEFVSSMEKASSLDLTQFRQWYREAGTPECSIKSEYDPQAQEYHLTVTQSSRANKPFYFPIKTALLDSEGQEITCKFNGQTTKEHILTISNESERFTFSQVAEKPIPSLLRDFSAPIKMSYDYSFEELALLFGHDPNAFNQYDAGQRIATLTFQNIFDQIKNNEEPNVPENVIEAYRSILTNSNLEDHFKSYALQLPALSTLLDAYEIFDVQTGSKARDFLANTLARKLEGEWISAYKETQSQGEYQFNAESVGKRAFGALCGSYLARLNKPEYEDLFFKRFNIATNMTDEISSLGLLANTDSDHRVSALNAFYEKWKANSLVMNKWFVTQALARREDLLSEVKILETNDCFDIKNPNKARSLFGAFAQNLTAFHDLSGAGYEWIASKIIEIDAFNPKVAANLATTFKKYSKLPSENKTKLQTQLQRILETKGLSQDAFEIVTNTIKSGE